MEEQFKAPSVIISLEEYEYLKEQIKELTLEVEELESRNASIEYVMSKMK